MVYAKTKVEFISRQEEFEDCGVCEKYPQYQTYLEKNFGGRVESWALFSRIERELPTHGSNTTAYAEISMRVTKETQFGRMKARNLPELLSVICDGSQVYKNKLNEIGNSRTWVLDKAKSKYNVKPSNVKKEDIADLGDGTYMVQSEVNDDNWHTCNMKTGYCSCATGVSCAPCRHKSAVSKHFNVTEFSSVPVNDPLQCGLYHYIANGTTLEPHMYRTRGDISSIPDIKGYIEEKLAAGNATREGPMAANENLMNQDEAEDFDMDEEDEHAKKEEMEAVKRNFVKAMEDYTAKVLELDHNGPGNVKAMRAMTKTLRKSLGCNQLTIQNQMHNFGKGGAASRVTPSGRIIRPNPPAISARSVPIAFCA